MKRHIDCSTAFGTGLPVAFHILETYLFRMRTKYEKDKHKLHEMMVQFNPLKIPSTRWDLNPGPSVI